MRFRAQVGYCVLALAIGLLSACAMPARAEDTAAVLATLPDEAAETRYLAELCERVGRGIENHERTLDDAIACARDTKCFNAVGKQVEKNTAAQAGVDVFDLLEADYDRAANVFFAKRNAPAPACRFLVDGSRKGVIERMQTLNATMRAQLGTKAPKKQRR